ncbi:MAG: DAK2 domain-containing protein [Lachnospiraceae bacterium]|nr:DAK2 domain-containing protein [Lachnospiraceae bacterium]
MSRTSIDSVLLTRMFLAGARNLEANKEWINELNVFPVPDGDTGTNMTMTILSAVREVAALGDETQMKPICKAMSSGSLRGARGNSGVILSQILRGFCKVAREQTELTVPLMADAFDKAVETAYKAVMKPKEGTILTVAKGAAVRSRELADQGVTDFDIYLPQILSYAEEVLASTPDMLPVLKQAGVVDSGGQGLVQIFKGAYAYYQGEEMDLDAFVHAVLHPEEAEQAGEEKKESQKSAKEIRYTYEMIFQIATDRPLIVKAELDLKNYLETISEEVSCKPEGDGLAVSLKTNDPGLVLMRALMYGQIKGVSIVNRRLDNAAGVQPDFAPEQVQEAAPQAEKKPFGFIAIAAGEGITEIFRSLGVDIVISGGQTMNPSTEDILNAVDELNADTVFVLPNNKNIVMAANQAAIMDSDKKKVIVIPTKTIPQGITAVISFTPELDAEANKTNMMEEISRVHSAEVTYAVRDTEIDDVEIKEGNMMAIGDNGILCVGDDRNVTALDALRAMVTDETELISIYYGEDVTEKEAASLQEKAAEAFPNIDIELQLGGQPVYYYILSAE